jgi:hypothetical protein
MVLVDWRATDGHWTIRASVDPKGSPTDVFVEYGPGPAASPSFTESIVVENDLNESSRRRQREIDSTRRRPGIHPE